MKRSKKITIFIIIFFSIIALTILGRHGMEFYFKKKFSKRPPPGVIIEVIANKNNLGIGAHPSYPDLVGFGRRPMTLTYTDIYNLITYQNHVNHKILYWILYLENQY